MLERLNRPNGAQLEELKHEDLVENREKVERVARELLNTADKQQLKAGRLIDGMVGAAVQLAVLGYCGKRVSNNLASTCLAGVAERTVSARFKELINMVLGLAQFLPFGKNITEKNLLKLHLKRALDHLHIAVKAAEQSACQGSPSAPAFQANQVKLAEREQHISAALDRIHRVSSPHESHRVPSDVTTLAVASRPPVVPGKRSRDSEQEIERLLVAGCDRHKLAEGYIQSCLLYTSPSPRDRTRYRMPSSA
eukprot:TRINITY_DN17210_c0_g1_i1.p1 TRINITY_DN17210_c0_g1~~TRINITY_DN17210_c0_g1_i1.p1  ORF type:complete len:252 (+),score=46.01 TRINITY_DN17210_c0_g1_i1:199-954(+)